MVKLKRKHTSADDTTPNDSLKPAPNPHPHQKPWLRIGIIAILIGVIVYVLTADESTFASKRKL